MKKFFFMILFSIFFGCANLDPFDACTSRIIGHVTETVKKKYGFSAGSVGVGGPEKIRCIILKFEYPTPLTIDDGRFYLVSIIGDALEFINSDEQVRPELMQYPYTYKDLEIALFPIVEKKSEIGKYGLFSSYYGKISYHKLGEDLKFNYTDPKKETFEEALQILKEQGRLPKYFQER